MENILNNLENQLSEFDYLFQEGVVFTMKDIKKLQYLINEFSKICRDPLLNISEDEG